MASSIIKTALFVATLSVGTSAIAVPANPSCKCNSEAAMVNCKKAEVANPTWWRWLTNGSSSQFHFFDLIELLHDSDKNKVAAQQKSNNEQVES